MDREKEAIQSYKEALKLNPNKQRAKEQLQALESKQSLQKEEQKIQSIKSVSYTHLTLPTKRIVQISVGGVSLKKKKKSSTMIWVAIQESIYTIIQTQSCQLY
eukprot:TRINITY_DN2974_c0_g1_i1.p3 TRINITY_DN2974_c0_g1~~TRINITY_DN2974_c0_g1_i1.p3  ORF type:complete len:103 (-),score=18.17 TRINITY_DN2974_c0_g1_i1:19-327(-)